MFALICSCYSLSIDIYLSSIMIMSNERENKYREQKTLINLQKRRERVSIRSLTPSARDLFDNETQQLHS